MNDYHVSDTKKSAHVSLTASVLFLEISARFSDNMYMTPINSQHKKRVEKV